MSKKSAALSLGKWMAGVAATIVGAVLVWWLTHPGGVLNPREQPPPTPSVATSSPSPTAATSLPSPTAATKITPPHAPAIKNTSGVELFEEKQQLIKVGSGQRVTLEGRKLWNAPALNEASCLSGFILLTWIVRDPYPEGGEDLQIEEPIPQNDQRTEKVASGASGSITMGMCSEITLFNSSLVNYQVEIRYACGEQ